jgi:hypothetical protein
MGKHGMKASVFSHITSIGIASSGMYILPCAKAPFLHHDISPDPVSAPFSSNVPVSTAFPARQSVISPGSSSQLHVIEIITLAKSPPPTPGRDAKYPKSVKAGCLYVVL